MPSSAGAGAAATTTDGTGAGWVAAACAAAGVECRRPLCGGCGRRRRSRSFFELASSHTRMQLYAKRSVRGDES
jgi:hypothetical protein